MLETSWRGSARFVDTVDDSEIGNSSTNSTDKEGANVLNSPFQHIINALSLWENVERVLFLVISYSESVTSGDEGEGFGTGRGSDGPVAV